MEFVSQEAERARNSLAEASKQLLTLERCGSLTAQNQQLQVIRRQVEELQSGVDSTVAESFEAWLAALPGVLHPLLLTDASAAWDAYAFALPPFNTPRLRKDIPDAFVYQAVSSLSKAHPVAFIAGDQNLATACRKLPSCDVHSSLEDWVSSPSVQQALLDLDVTDTLATYIAAFQQHDLATSAFSQPLKTGRLADLSGEIISSPSIPDDNHEAAISGWEDPDTVDIDFANLHYFGGGEFGLPFSFTTSVLADYYIYKADYYTLPDEMSPSVTDHNDHYFAAEGEYSVTVRGMAKLSFNPADLKAIGVPLAAGRFAFGVDSVDSVEIDE